MAVIIYRLNHNASRTQTVLHMYIRIYRVTESTYMIVTVDTPHHATCVNVHQRMSVMP